MRVENIHYLAVFKKTDTFRRNPYFLRWEADEKKEAYKIKLESNVTNHIMIQFAQEDSAKRWFGRFTQSDEYKWFLEDYGKDFACNFIQVYSCRPVKNGCFSVKTEE